MKNHGLIKLLKTLSEAEIKSFNDFVCSPYFNKRQAVVRLCEEILKQYPDFEGEELSKQTLYRKLFPGKKYNDSSFRAIVSYLNDLAMSFTVQRTFEDDKPGYELLKIKTMIGRSYYKLNESFFKSSMENLEKSKLLSEDLFFYKNSFHDFYIYYIQTKYAGIFEKHLKEIDFTEVVENAVAYSCIKILKSYIVSLNIQKLYNTDYDTGYLDKMFRGMNEDLIKRHPVIEIYRLIVMMLVTEHEEYFFKAKELLSRIAGKLNIHDIDEILINLGNYTSRKISTGYREFITEKFDLVKTELKHKSFNVNGYMSFPYYKTTISLALMLKQHSFAADFIEKYYKEMREDIRMDGYYYGKAMYEFNMENFDQSLKFLSKSNFHDLYAKLDLKVFQIVLYYELEYDEALLSAIEAFRHFLKNNKLLTRTRHPYYYYFYQGIKKLARLRQNGNEYDVQLFKKEFLEKHAFINMNWMLKKTDQLEIVHKHKK